MLIFVQVVRSIGGGVYEGPVTPFAYMEYLTVACKIYGTVADSNLLAFLNPLLESAKHFGVENTTDLKYLVYVIYYMCYQELQRRMNPRLESINYKKGEVGIVELECPEQILDSFGEHIGIAHWLYGSMLTPPHNNHEWRNWYLTKLLRVEKWTVLFAINEAEMIPNSVLCPAFALAVRISANGQKEAVISVRGTSATKDIAIDIQEDGADFEYHSGSAPGNIVVGKVHSGMLRSAKAILDDYGIRFPLERLAIEGYCIKVVGHSLGAGTAALIAAELKNGFMKSLNQGNMSSLPRIVAFAYATPCCTSADLAHAMATDELVYSLINRDDPVPRVNRATAIRFFDEAKLFSAKATEWCSADLKDYAGYAIFLGQNPADIKNAKSKETPSVTKFNFAEPSTETKSSISNSESKQNWIGIPLFVPGVVVCMYMDPVGTIRATLGDHRMVALQSLSYVSKIVLPHHSLNSYLDSLRCLRSLRHLPTTCTLPELEDEDTALELMDVRKCGVCGLNPTWLFLCKGDAMRAFVSHTCAICRRICCSMCAPASDVIPGEGFDSDEKLDVDTRISLPSKGLLSPQRVCQPCYFSCYSA